LRTPSVASSGLLDEPVCGEEEGGKKKKKKKKKNSEKIGDDTCKVQHDSSLDCQSLDRIKEM